MKTPISSLPLSRAKLHVLLALVNEDRHGYAIMQEIRTNSESDYKIGPGTLYDNLQKIVRQGIIEESRRFGQDKDVRRRCYRLTNLGRTVLTSELDRLEQIVRIGKMLLEPALGKSG